MIIIHDIIYDYIYIDIRRTHAHDAHVFIIYIDIYKWAIVAKWNANLQWHK